MSRRSHTAQVPADLRLSLAARTASLRPWVFADALISDPPSNRRRASKSAAAMATAKPAQGTTLNRNG